MARNRKEGSLHTIKLKVMLSSGMKYYRALCVTQIQIMAIRVSCGNYKAQTGTEI